MAQNVHVLLPSRTDDRAPLSIFEVDPYSDLVRLGLLPGASRSELRSRTAAAKRSSAQRSAMLTIEELDAFGAGGPAVASLCWSGAPSDSEVYAEPLSA